MSHFRGAITKSARKTDATAPATANTGLVVEAQSHNGKVSIELNCINGTDVFTVRMHSHHNPNDPNAVPHGDEGFVAAGIIGRIETVRVREVTE